MKLLTVLAATAVAAAVAAALSISAGADPRAGAGATKLATCLHARGAADAPSGADAVALKQWLAVHADSAAVTACNPRSAAPAGLVSCLRAHGLNPPDNLFQLKPWMLRRARSDAGKAVLKACKVDFNPPRRTVAGKDITTCLRAHGADVPAGATGRALKTWVRDHSSDPKVMNALRLCNGDMEKAPKGGGSRPLRRIAEPGIGSAACRSPATSRPDLRAAGAG